MGNKFNLNTTYLLSFIFLFCFISLLVVNFVPKTDKENPSFEDPDTSIGDNTAELPENNKEDDSEKPNEEDSSNTEKEDEPTVPIVVDFSQLTYAAIGDSITYGFCGDHSKPPFANNYPSCLKAYLGLQSVANYGACGCLVSRSTNPAYSSMIDKLDLISADTDIISVFGGINDYATYAVMGDINSTDEYTIYGAFNSIASKLKTNYPDAFIFFITPLPLGESNIRDVNNTAYTVRDVCNAILEVGEKWDIPVFDANLYADFDPDSDSFDGCHPTEAYYSGTFSSKLIAFIRENYS